MSIWRVKVSFSFREKLKNQFVNFNFAQRLADVAIKEMKKYVAAGRSPVEGVGRFPEYKAVGRVKEQRKRAKAIGSWAKKASASSKRGVQRSASTARKKIGVIKKSGYPYSVMDDYPSKKIRPVNLFLSGKMLRDIGWARNVAKRSVTIGIFKGLSKKKAMTHNEGTQAPRVPQRKFMPTGKGDDFIISIRRALKAIVTERLAELIENARK